MFKTIKEVAKKQFRRKVAKDAHDNDLNRLNNDICNGRALAFNSNDLVSMYKSKMYNKEYNRVYTKCCFDRDNSIPEDTKADIVIAFIREAVNSGNLTENYELVEEYIIVEKSNR